MKGNKKMHELGIALQIVRIAVKAIPEDARQARVEKVHVNVGKLSAVVPDSLTFCFGFATRETPLEGARLVIREIPAKARCRVCSHEWAIDGFVFACPDCGGGDMEIVSGRELDVESIEIAE